MQTSESNGPGTPVTQTSLLVVTLLVCATASGSESSLRLASPTRSHAGHPYYVLWNLVCRPAKHTRTRQVQPRMIPHGYILGKS